MQYSTLYTTAVQPPSHNQSYIYIGKKSMAILQRSALASDVLHLS